MANAGRFVSAAFRTADLFKARELVPSRLARNIGKWILKVVRLFSGLEEVGVSDEAAGEAPEMNRV